VISGGVNPHYKLALAGGFNATTTLSVTAQNLEVVRGSGFAQYFQAANPTLKAFVRMDGLFPFSPAPSFTDNPPADSLAEDRAVRALYAKMREVKNQFQGGTFLGEIHQTVNLIMRPLNALGASSVKYLTKQHAVLASAKKGINRTSKKGLRKKLTDNYLEWTFGVVPLMSDIEDLSKALARIASDPPRVRFTARGVSESESVVDLGAAFTGFLAVRSKLRTVNRTEVKYYGAFKEMQNGQGIGEKAARISELTGFDLRSFVPTIWNLIPYSFVADYFINIGDMLEAATTDTSVIAWLSRTQVVDQSQILEADVDVSVTADTIVSNGWVPDVISGGHGGYTATSRTILRGPSTVPIMMPALKIGNNPGRHCLNLAALVGSRLFK